MNSERMDISLQEVDEATYAWDSQEATYRQIREEGMSEYVGSLPSWKGAFIDAETPCLCCMDEGVALPGSYRAAGSLLGQPIEVVRAFCEATGVRHISSHEGCGAVAALYRKYLEEQGRDPEADFSYADVEEFSKVETKKMVEALGSEYGYAGHIGLAQLRRPADRHIARAAYYNAASSSFTPSAVPGLLPGFVIDRKTGESDLYLSQVRLAVDIAFGPHGWGERISRESPFLLILITDPDVDSSQVTAEFEELSSQYDGRVSIEYCQAPSLKDQSGKPAEEYRQAA